MNKKKKKKNIKYILKIIMVFFVLFDISFKIAPVISTAKLTLLFLLYYQVNNKEGKAKIVNGELYILIGYFFVLLHVVLAYFFNGRPETTTIARVIYYLIYSLYLSLVFSSIFSSQEEFLEVLISAIFIQSIFVVISWFSIEYRILIDKLLVQTGNISLLSSKRPPGFMNSAGAKASVTLAIGSIFTFKKITSTNTKKIKLIYYIILIVELFATFIVGRTGLILFFVTIIPILIEEKKKIQMTKHILGFILVLIISLSLFFVFIPDRFSESLSNKLEWVSSEFTAGFLNSNTVKVIKNMPIKQLSIETIVGTSSIRVEGGQHDSGFIQNYHAMGLVYSLFFYFLVLFHLLLILYKTKNKKFIKENRKLLLFLIISLFVIELKEPFILSYSYVLILLTIMKI